MKKKILLWLPLIILGVVLLFFIVRTDHSNYVPQQRSLPTKSSFNLKLRIKKSDSTDLLNLFPYDIYLDSADRWNIGSIKNDLKVLDDAYNDSSMNRQVLSIALTSKLFSRIDNYLNKYNPDTLIYLIQWAEKFQDYALIEPENDLFYNSICSYWLSSLSNKIHFYSTQNNSIKYDFKFKYIVARLTELSSNPGIGVTKFEKVIDNVVSNKWSHLIESSWNQTSLLQKLAFFMIVFITIYGYYCIIRKHLFRK